MRKVAIILGLTLAVVILIAVLVEVRTRKDNGFIEAACYPGSPVRVVKWKKDVFPLPLLVSQATSEKWVTTVDVARDRWNLAGEKRLFGMPIVTTGSGPSKCKDLKAGDGPVIFVSGILSDGTKEMGYSHARLYWNAMCELMCVEVYLPELANRDLWEKVATHELGHALGLYHDEIESSVMFPGGEVLFRAMENITEKDSELLKSAY